MVESPRWSELKENKPQSPSRRRSPQRPQQINKGLEALGHAKRLQAEGQWLAEGKQLSPGLQPLRPEDLPPGVTAARGYDHRGHCLTFAHATLGELGKIVLSATHDGHTLLQAELSDFKVHSHGTCGA